MMQLLPSKLEALSSTSSNAKNKKVSQSNLGLLLTTRRISNFKRDNIRVTSYFL
jgi:hypothetical protein